MSRWLLGAAVVGRRVGILQIARSNAQGVPYEGNPRARSTIVAEVGLRRDRQPTEAGARAGS